MSTNVNCSGELVFKDESSLKKGSAILITNGYLEINDDGESSFRSESYVEADDVIDGLNLSIPFSNYRNLNSVISDVLNLAAQGTYSWFITDGYYAIGRWTDGVYNVEKDIQKIISLSGANAKEADSITLTEDEWNEKYSSDVDVDGFCNDGGLDYYDTVDKVLSAAMSNLK